MREQSDDIKSINKVEWPEKDDLRMRERMVRQGETKKDGNRHAYDTDRYVPLGWLEKKVKQNKMME